MHCFCFLMVGVSPRSRGPSGRLTLPIPRGGKGQTEDLLHGERGCPSLLPPSLLTSCSWGRMSSAWRRQGCRGLSWQESGNQNICAQAWAPQPLMVLTELLWSVVWKICILRRARGGPRHRRPWRYLNITASPWGEVRAGGSRAARPASRFVSDLRFMHFCLLPRLGLCVGRDWRKINFS